MEQRKEQCGERDSSGIAAGQREHWQETPPEQRFLQSNRVRNLMMLLLDCNRVFTSPT
jgi:hypothetical protein